MSLRRASLLVSLVLPGIAACSRGDATPGSSHRFQIAVTEDGFKPDNIRVPSRTAVTLIFERKTDATCAKDVVVNVGDQQRIEKTLPLNQPVEVVVTFPRAGKLTYACSMDMVKGEIVVQ